jgi:hypothetical protein
MCFTYEKLGTFRKQTLRFFTCLFMKFGSGFLTTGLLDVKEILKINLNFSKLQSIFSYWNVCIC